MGVICTFLSTFLKALNDFKIVLEKNRKEWGTKKMTGCSGQSVGSASCDLMWRGWGMVEGLLMLGFFSLFPGGSLVSSPALGGSAQPLCIHALNPPVSGWPAALVSVLSLKTLGLTPSREGASDLLDLGGPSPGHYLAVKGWRMGENWHPIPSWNSLTLISAFSLISSGIQSHKCFNVLRDFVMWIGMALSILCC